MLPVAFPRDDPPFPGSLPEFQQLFPDDLACAAYLEAIRWPQGFTCMWCGEAGEPYRFKARPYVMVCRKCKRDNRIMAGTVMQDCRVAQPLLAFAPTDPTVRRYRSGLFRTDLRRVDHRYQA